MPRDTALQFDCAGAVAAKQRIMRRLERAVRIDVTPRRIRSGDTGTIARGWDGVDTRMCQFGSADWAGGVVSYFVVVNVAGR